MSINTNNTISNAINSYQSQVVKKNETAANKAKTTEDTAAKKAAEKKTILKRDYDLVLTPVMEEELTKMGSLALGIAERAKTEGELAGHRKGLLEGRREGEKEPAPALACARCLAAETRSSTRRIPTSCTSISAQRRSSL